MPAAVLWKCTVCGKTGSLPLPMKPIWHCGVRHVYPMGVLREMPGLLQRMVNFTGALVKHALSGREQVDDATRRWRLEQCLSCQQYFDPTNETCTHPRCGCGIKKKRGIIDKLSWATQQCPIGRWKYQPVTRRNLIYHACALERNDLWRRNVRQVARRDRWDQFNGRRVIAISRGEGIQHEAVHEELRGLDYEHVYIDNDAQLREVASFRPLLEMIQSTSRDETTFYAHTKGNSTRGNVMGATRWRNLMYDKLLTDQAAATAPLDSYAAVGCNKVVWMNKRPPYPSGLRHGQWMFAGTFFWFRHDVIFGHRDWYNVPQDRYGAEAWLSGLIGWWQAHSVFQPWPETRYPPPSPYSPKHYPPEYDVEIDPEIDQEIAPDDSAQERDAQ